MAETKTIGVYSPIGSATSTTTAAKNTISDSALSGAVTNILGFDEKAATDTANAKAADASVTGYNAEKTAYDQVGTIAANNAALAKASGDIIGYQDQLKALTTIGEQKAAVASNGFRESGSNLDLLRSSLQQGYLKQQLDETQTNINVGGYLAEGAAAKAESSAASAAADSATALAGSYRSASTLATTNAANETAALNTYLGKTPLTTAESLLVSPLGSAITDTNIPTSGTKVGVGGIGTSNSNTDSSSTATVKTTTSSSSSNPVFKGSETTGVLSTTFGI